MTRQPNRADRLATALQQLQDATAVVRDLADEMGQWRDNISGTNLENTDRGQRVSECADAVEQAADSLESAISDLESVEFPTARD